MAGGPVYVVLDARGVIQAVEKTVRQAVNAAGAIAPEVVVDIAPRETSDGLSGLGDFGAVEDIPQVSLERSGLHRIDFDRVMKMSLEEAYEKVAPLFTRLRKKNPTTGIVGPIAAYRTPLGLSDALLGQNWKTSKATPEKPSDVQGLSLLPHKLALATDTNWAKATPMRSVCVGASPACRAACLVYSGRNEADIYNTEVKFARTRALIDHPEHFMRLLVHTVGKHAKRNHQMRTRHWTDKKGKKHSETTGPWESFVRLNVFSDVPWELVMPELFEHFSDLQFYDYTKVAARQPPKNYDLTFSFSGTNKDLVNYELKRGSRVAVVFLHPEGLAWLDSGERAAGYGLPLAIKGIPVKDGDLSDVRPRDPRPGLVGLRWKPPKKAGEKNVEERVQRETGAKGTFAVDEAQAATVVEAFPFFGSLITAVAARDQPIVDPDGLDLELGEAAE